MSTNKKRFCFVCFFELHQTTESFYNAILLVFSGYKPKLHDIRKLGSIAGNYNEELWQIFPHSSVEQRQCFRLLEQAYVEARYNKDYRITKEQLLYLIDRVKKLKTVTEKICLERINKEII
ncbi:HEPN domain-containing protein [Candidatus Tisiphia endosymbiont of Myopa tessellatipennis]|uniref:HEPN domain-containing protein n=1 Tax=Candidatus Tisiphia endosymbiont of Myopa tessellatipennis TaxID=3066257 RepID=UPI00313A7F40